MTSQVTADVGVCSHEHTDCVLNYGNDIIAWRCKSCTLITAHHGTCGNCNNPDVKLPRFARRVKFCSTECETRYNSRVAKERAAARKVGK